MNASAAAARTQKNDLINYEALVRRVAYWFPQKKFEVYRIPNIFHPLKLLSYARLKLLNLT
jgi:hypothetical protein